MAKLIEKPETEGPQLPPMPTLPTLTSLGSLGVLESPSGTLPPQPSSFMPFLEKLQPSVLQQLQSNIRNSNQQGKFYLLFLIRLTIIVIPKLNRKVLLYS